MSAIHFLNVTRNYERGLHRGLDDVYDWISTLPLPKGRRGTTTPLGWQEMLMVYVLGRLYGVECEQQTLVCIPRKQGKTSFSGCLGLAALRFARDEAVKIYSAATQRDQAQLVLHDAQVSLRRLPEAMAPSRRSGAPVEYRDKFRVLQHRIERADEPESSWRAVAAESNSLEGLFPNLVIIDEAAVVPDGIYQVFDSAWNDAVDYQHLLAISTASRYMEWWFGDMLRSAAWAMYDGNSNPGFNLMLWMPPENRETGACLLTEQDRGDPRVWERLNPSWGTTVGLQSMTALWRKAKINRRAMLEFRIKRLNEWGLSDRKQLFSPAQAAELSRPDHDELVERALVECPCAVGIDLSTSGDVTGVAVVALLPDESLAATVHGFMSRESYDNRISSARGEVFERFRAEGHITIAGVERIDWQQVKRYLEGLVAKYKPLELRADRMTQGIRLRKLIRYDLPVDLQEFGLSKRERITGCNFFVDTATSQQYKFHDNRWLRWELVNAHTVDYPDGGCQVVRQSAGSTNGIDGVYAIIHGSYRFRDLTAAPIPEEEVARERFLNEMYDKYDVR